MKTINVVAACILNNKKVFAAERGYGNYAGFWEFPGGKIEKGETPEQALVREIEEELNVEITMDRFLTDVEYEYPEFFVKMKCFLCHVEKGEIELLEHSDSAWLGNGNINSVKWLPSAFPIIDELSKIL